jgi:hypothetical protein
LHVIVLVALPLAQIFIPSRPDGMSDANALIRIREGWRGMGREG